MNMANLDPKLINWQPPAGYQPVESSVEGILVYAPKTEVVQSEAPAVFKCPRCGAITHYDVSAGGVACEHCGYVASPPAGKVGRGAKEFEFTLQTWKQAEQGWGVNRKELHCESCGDGTHGCAATALLDSLQNPTRDHSIASA
jgi:ribosomal protein S27AE